MIAFFEVINTSAPHIYHSALPVSPQTSIIRDRYKKYARPLTRVIWGLPTLWEPTVATMYWDASVGAVAWSPCSRFIATARSGPSTVQLLDAATLGLLHVFQPTNGWLGSGSLLSFSPDSRSLTLHAVEAIITWDVQTGGEAANIQTGRKAANIPTAKYEDGFSSTYSIDGRFFALLSKDRLDNRFHLTSYDLLLGTRTDHFRALTGPIAPQIWTHGGCIRFATVKNRSITISEVGFASTYPPVEVESFPAPDGIAHANEFLFLPALSRLAFVLIGAIEVWDAQNSRTLLECTETASNMTFSADGHLFAYAANLQEVLVWKESAAGYELHQQLPFTPPSNGELILSPSGRSILMASQSIYLSSTADPTLPLFSISKFDLRVGFTLAFSPDESLAAIARKLGNTITVVNLTSGDRRLVIETDITIRALGVTGSTLVAVGGGKVVAWTIPTGDDVFNALTNINDSVRTTILDQPGLSSGDLFTSASISPSRNFIAGVGGFGDSGDLRVYDVSTGRCLGGVETGEVGTPRFTPDGCEVWIVDPSTPGGWAIVEDEESSLIKLEPLESTACPPGVLPWRSSRGHYVHDGWVMNSARERVLWLPHRWRSGELDMEWNRLFLGLLHRELPGAVILEVCD